MPLDAWVLLVVSIGLGLGLELAFMRAQRREARAVRDGRASRLRPDRDP
jgi:hypothetical protein